MKKQLIIIALTMFLLASVFVKRCEAEERWYFHKYVPVVTLVTKMHTGQKVITAFVFRRFIKRNIEWHWTLSATARDGEFINGIAPSLPEAQKQIILSLQGLKETMRKGK